MNNDKRMMNLFAKYLPIDGKVEEGDFVMITSTLYGDSYLKIYYCCGVGRGADEKSLALKSNINLVQADLIINVTQVQRMRLFLCTMNMEKGDSIVKFRNTLDFEEIVFDDSIVSPLIESSVVIFHGVTVGYRYQFCKVLGEVSRDVLFLEDEQELEPEDTKLYLKIGENIYPEYMWHKLDSNTYNKDKIVNYYRIKCNSCKIFH